MRSDILMKYEKGASLILVFILVMALLGLVSSFLFMAAHQMRQAGGQLDDEKAFYAAQAGLRKAVWRMIRPDPPQNWTYQEPNPSPGTQKYEELGTINTGDNITASYRVRVFCMSVECGTGSGDIRDFRIESEATVHDITRRVERWYRADLSEDEFPPIQNTWKEI